MFPAGLAQAGAGAAEFTGGDASAFGEGIGAVPTAAAEGAFQPFGTFAADIPTSAAGTLSAAGPAVLPFGAPPTGGAAPALAGQLPPVGTTFRPLLPEAAPAAGQALSPTALADPGALEALGAPQQPAAQPLDPSLQRAQQDAQAALTAANIAQIRGSANQEASGFELQAQQARADALSSQQQSNLLGNQK